LTDAVKTKIVKEQKNQQGSVHPQLGKKPGEQRKITRQFYRKLENNLNFCRQWGGIFKNLLRKLSTGVSLP
jgi:hypothetical protein